MRQNVSILISCILLSSYAWGQQDQKQPSSLGLEKGCTIVNTKKLRLEVLNSSQTVSELKTVDEDPFDFTPHTRLSERDKDGFYHLGDINLRVKAVGETAWKDYSTATQRHDVESVKSASSNVFAAKLNNSLPAEIPLEITRYWEVDGDYPVMRFELKNKSSEALEIGALGFPLVFNNNFNRKTLDEAHTENVFFDPYIGKDAGYLQVVRLHGKGKVLVVVPYGETPFEAYRPLLDDPTPRGFTFEGLHEWMVYSKAYSENEWKGVSQWNTPTSVVLKPGETRSYGLKFLLADDLKNVESTLVQEQRPVAVGVPGYVLPKDVDGKLFLKYNKKIKTLTVYPENALTIETSGVSQNGWNVLQLKGKIWGRSVLSITYEDGLEQTINYNVIESETDVVSSFGNFLLTEQWFDQPNDVFGRSPSVISYDYEDKKQITQDTRAWVAGLSDEGGAGSWLAAIMKQLLIPNKEEVKKLEAFVNQTIWGGIQYNEGDLKYGVKKSLFYYEPDSMPAGTYSPDIDYSTWAAWPKKEADSPGRSYNYPHVAAAHWVMYRLARNYVGLVSQESWETYLEHAYQTGLAMMKHAPHYAQFGQMEGTIFLMILEDLKMEKWDKQAAEFEQVMRARAEHWASLNYPFGSEMPWDSTGQEEVYMWSRYFGFNERADVTLNAILAYMPTVPHWAYNGNARRYWDFLYGGKISRVERQIHHYGSALNAIPVLHQYRENPDDLYLLRVGYGGVLGGISNITQDGFGPCAFHSFPSTLAIDALSGDYGTGFFGYAVNTASFLMKDDEFGWLSFGGNTKEEGDWIVLELTTAGKSNVYIAPAKLSLSLESGKFSRVAYNKKTGAVKCVFEKASQNTPNALLRVESKGQNKPAYGISQSTPDNRGLYTIKLDKAEKEVSLQSNK